MYCFDPLSRHMTINHLPHNSIYLQYILSLRAIENNVGKTENAGYKHYVPFPQCEERMFQMALHSINPLPYNAYF